MEETEKATWAVALEQQRKLRKKGSEMLFDRVKLLVKCYEDQEFRNWVASQETNEYDFLDEELSDTAASFLTLKAVMDEHPKREDWVRHNIRDLIALVLEAEREKKKRDGDHRISWKERALAAEKECERLRAELESTKKSLEIVASAKCG